MKIGDKVNIRENARVILGLPDDVEFTVKDILDDNVDFPIVLTAEEFGEDWVEFFREDEIITI